MSSAIYTKFSPSEIDKFLKLLIPLALTGFLEASVGFFSTLFLAHLGTIELAAGAIAQWFFFTLIVIVWGAVTSISVVVAQKFGARDDEGIAQTLFDGFIFCIILTIPAVILLKNIAPILNFFGQDAITVKLAADYMQGMVWALLPDFVTIVLLQFLIGIGHTRTNMLFSLCWVPLNVLCNYILIFGKLGLPALGIGGIGWGTAVSYWIAFVTISIYILVKPQYRLYLRFLAKIKRPRYLGELCQVGLPIGIMFCIEVAFFLVLTLLMGHISLVELAANQITLQFMGQTSVITFAVAQALTVRMGHAIGAKHFAEAQRAAYIGTIVAVGVMFLIALCYWLIPKKLIMLDLNVHALQNKAIIAYAVKFLAWCAVFQLLESVRFALFGALRSLKDTRFTLFISIISFWVIALPCGYFFAVILAHGGVGMWWGLVLGGWFSMLTLTWRFYVKMKTKLPHFQ